MKAKTIRNYLLGVSLPILILFSMTFMPVYTTFFGEEILLKTSPFDPRDLFRGDHVILNYEASEIKTELLSEDIHQAFKDNNYHQYYGEDIYVVVEKKESKYHEAKLATFIEPEEGIYIKGTIDNFNVSYNPPNQPKPPVGEEEFSEEYKEKMLQEKYDPQYEQLTSVIVDFKLDKYFVQENTGKDLEEASMKGQLVARVKVYKGYPLVIEVIKE